MSETRILCECGSELESEYNTTTNGFDCEECRATIVECECGIAYYAAESDGECPSCGEVTA